MGDTAKKRVSVAEAARMLYRSQDEERINRVLYLLSRGELTGTTRAIDVDSIAAYRAKKSESRRVGAASKPESRSWKSTEHEGERELRHTYRDIVQDYLMDVFTNRNRSSWSKGRRQAVTIGQIVFIFATFAMLFSTFRWVTGEPRHKRLVASYIDENFKDPVVKTWHEPQPRDGKLLVRVEFRYKRGTRVVLTDRRFLVGEDGQVTALTGKASPDVIDK